MTQAILEKFAKKFRTPSHLFYSPIMRKKMLIFRKNKLERGATTSSRTIECAYDRLLRLRALLPTVFLSGMQQKAIQNTHSRRVYRGRRSSTSDDAWCVNRSADRPGLFIIVPLSVLLYFAYFVTIAILTATVFVYLFASREKTAFKRTNDAMAAVFSLLSDIDPSWLDWRWFLGKRLPQLL